MAKEPTSGRIKKYGVCLNDKCDQYKVVQEISHGELECPCCKKKLSPCAPPTTTKRKPYLLYACIAAVVLAAVIGAVIAFSGGDSKQEPKSEPTSEGTSVNDSIKKDSVKVADPVKVEEPGKVADPKVDPVEKPKEPVADGGEKKAPGGGSSSTVNLGYAKFTGSVKNGKPNGMGTMRFSSSHQIDSRDPKARVADAGDYVIGEWKDGKLIQGKWYDSSNTVKGGIMIGM